MRVDGTIPDLESKNSLRLVSFNINGFNTLKHYHPWNELDTLSNILNFFKADIITFQELKLQKSNIDFSLAYINDYYSFISLPLIKKGYSGISVFIKKRINNENIKVIKVEEGITGYLDVSSQPGMNYRKIWDKYNESGLSIGGYTHNLRDWKEAMKLDSDGRSIIIELNNNIVIFSLYCPANSMNTEDEEDKRCLFLDVLFQRVENLEKMGKHVIIMGDINVSPSLIDRDDEINIGLNDGTLIKPNTNKDQFFEKINKDQVIKFRNDTVSRKILNSYLFDLNNICESNENKNLFDLGRMKNQNRLKMYTCWNTLKNNRPMNIGSRIDLFLGTTKIKDCVEKCDIWPFLYGSDHCPIFLDINTQSFFIDINKAQHIKHFETASFYKLGTTKKIDLFFKTSSKSQETQKKITVEKTNTKHTLQDTNSEVSRSSTSLPVYQSRKKPKLQSTLVGLIKAKTAESELKSNPTTSSLFVSSDAEDEDSEDYSHNSNINLQISQPKKHAMTTSTFAQMLALPKIASTPNCQHGERCVLRTTKSGANSGRKFWCCSKPKENSTWEVSNTEKGLPSCNDSTSPEYSCNFFKWATK